jgi:hypothetical protein
MTKSYNITGKAFRCASTLTDVADNAPIMDHHDKSLVLRLVTTMVGKILGTIDDQQAKHFALAFYQSVTDDLFSYRSLVVSEYWDPTFCIYFSATSHPYMFFK